MTPIPQWPGEPVDVGDRVVFVRRAPSTAVHPEPAVFVHGLGGSAANWTDLMGELRDIVDGRALDLSGFGRSTPPPGGDYSVSGHAAAVTGLIEATADAPVHLFGNSLGGAVATRVAAVRPDLVRSLTLVSPALPDLWPRISAMRMAGASIPGVGSAVLKRLRWVPADRRVRAAFAGMYYDPSRVPEERLREAIEDTRQADEREYGVDALGGSLRGIVTEYLRPPGPSALWRQAARVTAPTLLVYGRHDQIVDPRVARRAARTFPRARVAIFGESGHVAQMEQPAEVARMFRGFRHSFDFEFGSDTGAGGGVADVTRPAAAD